MKDLFEDWQEVWQVPLNLNWPQRVIWHAKRFKDFRSEFFATKEQAESFLAWSKNEAIDAERRKQEVIQKIRAGEGV